MAKKKIQLFLLPFAGGSSLSFMRLIRLLDSGIETITVEYAGRGSRKNEAYIKSYDDFINDVVGFITSRRSNNLPFAVLGYSLGSAIAFDICCKHLLEQKPVHCFFCAEGGLKSKNQARKYGSLSKEEFLDKMIILGGLDDRLLNNSQALDSYLKLIKSDFNILGQFSCESGTVETDSSIIYSSDDDTCTSMDDWNCLISGQVKYYDLGQGHFFINKSYKEMAGIINEELVHFM